jgi:hypothetical protein
MDGFVEPPGTDEMMSPSTGGKNIVWKLRNATDLSRNTARQAAVQHAPWCHGLKVLFLTRETDLPQGGCPAPLRARRSETWRRRNLSDGEAPTLEIPPSGDELGIAPDSGSEAEAQLTRVGAEDLI